MVAEHANDYQPPSPVKIPPAADAMRYAMRTGAAWPRHRSRARAQRKAAAERRSGYAQPQTRPDQRPTYNAVNGQLSYPRGVERTEPYGSMVASENRVAAAEAAAARKGVR